MNEHINIICDQFSLTIEKLIEEGYSEIDIMKALSLTLYEFVDGFEEIEE